jgi:hypothetical protein
LALTFSLVVIVLGLSHALLKYSPYALVDNPAAQAHVVANAAPTEGDEYLPTFYGVRLKITDTA